MSKVGWRAGDLIWSPSALLLYRAAAVGWPDCEVQGRPPCYPPPVDTTRAAPSPDETLKVTLVYSVWDSLHNDVRSVRARTWGGWGSPCLCAGGRRTDLAVALRPTCSAPAPTLRTTIGESVQNSVRSAHELGAGPKCAIPIRLMAADWPQP